MFTAVCHLEENTMKKIKGGMLLDGHSEKIWEGRIWTVNKEFMSMYGKTKIVL